MSRIGKEPVMIPDGIKVEIQPGAVLVNGPKGELKVNINPVVKVEQTDNQLNIQSNV